MKMSKYGNEGRKSENFKIELGENEKLRGKLKNLGNQLSNV